MSKLDFLLKENTTKLLRKRVLKCLFPTIFNLFENMCEQGVASYKFINLQYKHFISMRNFHSPCVVLMKIGFEVSTSRKTDRRLS